MTESKIAKVLEQLRTDYEAYSHNQNNVVKAAEALEAIEVIESLCNLQGKVIEAWKSYERFGAGCTFEGCPMISAAELEELYEAALQSNEAKS